MKKTLINIGKFLVFLSIGLGILYWVFQRQNKAYQEECALNGISPEDCSLVGKILEDFANANYFWIFMVLVVFTISNISRAIRWKMIIRPLGYNPRLINVFFSTLITYFANLFLPRLGEVARAGTLSRYEKIPLEKVMGTVVLDRIVDVVCMLTATALALALEYDRIWAFVDENVNLTERFGGLGSLLAWAVGAGVLVIVGFFIFRKSIQATSIYKKLLNIAKGFWEGLISIRQLEKPWMFVFHTINIWMMYFLITYLCFFAFEPTSHLGAIAGLVTFVFGGWGIVIPSPGGMGTYHFMIQTALILFGVAADDAFSYAMIAFVSVNFGCNIVMGLMASILYPIINKDYHPEPPVLSTEEVLQS